MSVNAFCSVSAAPLRAEPKESAEMVSQMLFGELCEVLDKHKSWCFIKMGLDGYEGWVDQWHVMKLRGEVEAFKRSFASELYNLALENKQPLTLPIGSELTLFKNGELRVGDKHWEFEGAANSILEDGDLSNKALEFINIPYLWGGRSSFGIDCSGLVQTLFKFFGIVLPRDAYQQAEKGSALDFLSEAKMGDLAFFDNEEGRITHVGVMLDGQQILHAHGKVRVDQLDSNGIFIKERNAYSHQLRFIRRVL